MGLRILSASLLLISAASAPGTNVLAQESAELAQVTSKLEEEARRILEETSIPAVSLAVVRNG